MKTRCGFVSNSSSSSFVAVGLEVEKLPPDFKEQFLQIMGRSDVLEKLDKNDEDYDCFLIDDFYDIISDSQYVFSEGFEKCNVFGYAIVKADYENNLPSDILSFPDVEKIKKDLVEKFSFLKEEDLKLIIGKVNC